jgi:hypothetical protein
VTLHSPEGWIATEATVTTCRYQARALSALAFGVRLGEAFRIGFSYYAHGQLYEGQFDSPVAIPQNERIPIAYNPLHPEQNNRVLTTPDIPGTRSPLIFIAIACSIPLAIGLLFLLRSCHSR